MAELLKAKPWLDQLTLAHRNRSMERSRAQDYSWSTRMIGAETAANTSRTLDCIRQGTVSSVSAMVFMEDSEEAADIARQQGIDSGLHLNLTTPFSAPRVSTQLSEHQHRISRYLLRNRFAQIVFHPGLVRSFEHVVAAQRDEFFRLYGEAPKRIDGHHHMHLCSNVLLAGLLPPGTLVRRNFTFQAGEKGFFNRSYRRIVDRRLARHHRLLDFFFALPPLDIPGRLEHIFSLAKTFAVEVESHPVQTDEYNFLMGDEIRRLTAGLQKARSSANVEAQNVNIVNR